MLPRFRTILICALLAGCSGSSDQAAKTDPRGAGENKLSSGPPDTSVADAKRPASPCPRTGRWALCSVERRLEQSGFVVKRISGEGPARAGFRVIPAVYMLGRSRLEVFIYPDEASLSRDVAKMDTVAVAPRDSVSHWEATPTFMRSGNLAAVFLSDSGQKVERLTLALTAGAPQP